MPAPTTVLENAYIAAATLVGSSFFLIQEAGMARFARGEAARRVWRERLERLANSGLSVKEFSAKEHVSVASVYQWRRRLASNQADRSGVEPASFRPVRIVGGSMVTVEFPDVAAMRVPAEQVDVVRAVVMELALASRSPNSC